MIVAASTECFGELSLHAALEKLVDLEYSAVEIAIDENGRQLKPSEVAADMAAAVTACQNTFRLDVASYAAYITAEGEEHYRQFDAICRLAKATKVVTVVAQSGELGTPFNEEVERLRRLVDIAKLQGVRVGVRSQVGRLTEDASTVTVLCDNVDGLGLTLDPSHYLCGSHAGKSIDKLLKYVFHVYLRDSTKENLQVRVGQGEIEYGRLVNQLNKHHYQRALCVHMAPIPDTDHMGEMRKMRLLLESLM